MSDKKLEIILAAKDITGKAFTSLQGRITAISKNVLSLQGAFVGLAGAAGIGALVKSSFELNDQLAKTSDRLGLSTEALAGLRHAAELTGAGTSTLDMALQRMTRRIAEAAQGTGAAVGALEELGLSAADLAGLSTDEAFRRIAEAMSNVKSQSDRVRLAFKLFDSEGVKLVNTLAMGANGLDAAAKEARDLGLAISRVDAAKIEEANDAFYRAQSAIRGVGNTLSIDLAPYVEQTATAFSDWVKANHDLINSKIGDYIDQIATAANKLWNMVQYDPAIVEYGLVGLLVGGKKGAAVVGGMAHMTNWAVNLTRAFELSAAGLIDFSDIAAANFKELEDLIKPFEGARIGEDGQLYSQDLEGQLKEAQAGLDALLEKQRKSVEQHYESLDEIRKKFPFQPLGTELTPAQGPIVSDELLHGQWTGKSVIENQIEKQKELIAVIQEKIRLEKIDLALIDAFDLSGVKKSSPAPIKKTVDETKKSAGELQTLYQGIDNDLNKFFTDLDANAENLRVDNALDGFFGDLDKQRDELQEHYDKMVLLTQSAASAMESSFSDLFFDSFTGQMDDISDYWQNMLNSMIRAYADFLANMATQELLGDNSENLLSGILKLFNWSSSSSSSSGSTTTGSGASPTELNYSGYDYSFDTGGILGEDIVGVGKRTGSSYALHANEYVVPQNKIAAGGGGGNTTNVFYIQANDAKSFHDMVKRNPGAILGVSQKAMLHNGGLRQVMRARL